MKNIYQIVIVSVVTVAIVGTLAAYAVFTYEPVTVGDLNLVNVWSVSFDSAHPNILLVNASFISSPQQPPLVFTTAQLKNLEHQIVAEGEVLEPNTLRVNDGPKTFTCRFNDPLPFGNYTITFVSTRDMMPMHCDPFTIP